MVRRCSELPVDRLKFWEETGVNEEQFGQWLAKEKPRLTALSATIDFVPAVRGLPSIPLEGQPGHGMGVIEFLATMADGKTHCKRVLLERVKGSDVPVEMESEHFDACARQWVRELESQFAMTISFCAPPGDA